MVTKEELEEMAKKRAESFAGLADVNENIKKMLAPIETTAKYLEKFYSERPQATLPDVSSMIKSFTYKDPKLEAAKEQIAIADAQRTALVEIATVLHQIRKGRKWQMLSAVAASTAAILAIIGLLYTYGLI